MTGFIDNTASGIAQSELGLGSSRRNPTGAVKKRDRPENNEQLMADEAKRTKIDLGQQARAHYTRGSGAAPAAPNAAAPSAAAPAASARFRHAPSGSSASSSVGPVRFSAGYNDADEYVSHSSRLDGHRTDVRSGNNSVAATQRARLDMYRSFGITVGGVSFDRADDKDNYDNRYDSEDSGGDNEGSRHSARSAATGAAAAAAVGKPGKSKKKARGGEVVKQFSNFDLSLYERQVAIASGVGTDRSAANAHASSSKKSEISKTTHAERENADMQSNKPNVDAMKRLMNRPLKYRRVPKREAAEFDTRPANQALVELYNTKLAMNRIRDEAMLDVVYAGDRVRPEHSVTNMISRDVMAMGVQNTIDRLARASVKRVHDAISIARDARKRIESANASVFDSIKLLRARRSAEAAAAAAAPVISGAAGAGVVAPEMPPEVHRISFAELAAMQNSEESVVFNAAVILNRALAAERSVELTASLADIGSDTGAGYRYADVVASIDSAALKSLIEKRNANVESFVRATHFAGNASKALNDYDLNIRNAVWPTSSPLLSAREMKNGERVRLSDVVDEANVNATYAKARIDIDNEAIRAARLTTKASESASYAAVGSIRTRLDAQSKSYIDNAVAAAIKHADALSASVTKAAAAAAAVAAANRSASDAASAVSLILGSPAGSTRTDAYDHGAPKQTIDVGVGVGVDANLRSSNNRIDMSTKHAAYDARFLIAGVVSAVFTAIDIAADALAAESRASVAASRAVIASVDAVDAIKAIAGIAAASYNGERRAGIDGSVARNGLGIAYGPSSAARDTLARALRSMSQLRDSANVQSRMAYDAINSADIIKYMGILNESIDYTPAAAAVAAGAMEDVPSNGGGNSNSRAPSASVHVDMNTRKKKCMEAMRLMVSTRANAKGKSDEASIIDSEVVDANNDAMRSVASLVSIMASVPMTRDNTMSVHAAAVSHAVDTSIGNIQSAARTVMNVTGAGAGDPDSIAALLAAMKTAKSPH
jgi:hypothetical protein